VPIQELKPQRQLDHVCTSVDVIDAPSSIATEHLSQAKYPSATYAQLGINIMHKEGTQAALTTTVSPMLVSFCRLGQLARAGTHVPAVDCFS